MRTDGASALLCASMVLPAACGGTTANAAADASGGMVDAPLNGTSLDGTVTLDGGTEGPEPEASTIGSDAAGANDMFRSVEWDATPSCDAASCSTLGTYCQSPPTQIGVTTPTYEECTDGGWGVPYGCDTSSATGNPHGVPCNPPFPIGTRCEWMVPQGVYTLGCTKAGWQ